MADLLIRIRADEGGTKGILKGVTDSIEDAGKASEKHGSLIGGLGDVLGKVGLAAMGIQAGIGVATGAVQGLIGPALDAQQVTAQLQSVLASTGGKAGVTQEAVENLSNALSKVTPFEDEAITSGQSLLLTFTNIGQDVFPQATETMLDMSQALGQDMKSSAIQLGKALNDPIKGITALTRVGVSFTEEQKDQIKTMAEAGDIAGAQALILKELQTEFGGAAKAAGETFGGQLTILQTALGNVQEAIGGPLLKVLNDLMKHLLPLITAFADALPGAIDDFLASMQPVVDFIGGFLIPHLTDLGTAITMVFQGDFQGAVDLLQTSIIPRIQDFGNTVVQWIADQLPLIGAKLQEWASTFIEWVKPLIPPLLVELGVLAHDLLQWIIDQGPPLLLQFGDWTKAAIGWVVQAATDIVPQLGEFLSGLLGWLRENAPSLAERFLAEFVPAAIGWVAQAAIEITPKLAVLLFEIGKWIVTEGVPGLVGLAIDLGEAIVRGLLKGLANVGGQVGGAVKNLANQAIASAKEALGISSPSREFERIGRQIGDGLIAGIRDRHAAVAAAAEDVTEVVTDAAEEIGRAWGSASLDLKEAQLAMGETFSSVARDAETFIADKASAALVDYIVTVAQWNRTQEEMATNAATATEAITTQAEAVRGAASQFTTAASSTKNFTLTTQGVGSTFAQALQAQVTPAASGGGGGGGGSSDPAVQHSLSTNGGDYFATYNFQKGLGSSDADAARIANEAAAAAGKRRYGGPVVRGQAYVVGEGGPELFVPRADGLVVPNQGAGAIGGPEVHLHVQGNVFTERDLLEFVRVGLLRLGSSNLSVGLA